MDDSYETIRRSTKFFVGREQRYFVPRCLREVVLDVPDSATQEETEALDSRLDELPCSGPEIGARLLGVASTGEPHHVWRNA